MKHVSLVITILFLTLAMASVPVQADGNGTVHVAAPTGDPAIDVANIEAAIAGAGPGDTVQFKRGTYRVFDDTQFLVATPGVTLQGARKGRTTLRATQVFAEIPFAGMFRLVGGGQTVRNLRFRDIYRALSIGEPGASLGGYLVENCVFRNGDSGIEFVSFSDDVSTVRNNRFVDLRNSIFLVGKTVHFHNNEVLSRNPEDIVATGLPYFAVTVLPEFFSGINVAENNRIEGNSFVGGADAIILFGNFPGEVNRNNVIRNNHATGLRIFNEFNDGSVVILAGSDVGAVEGNIVENNELEGSEGVGIPLEGADNNLITDNEIEDLSGDKETFSTTFLGAERGTGIFLDATSEGNVVDENELEDVQVGILDLGDNLVGDNEIETDDEDGESDARALPGVVKGLGAASALGKSAETPSALPAGKAVNNATFSRRRAR